MREAVHLCQGSKYSAPACLLVEDTEFIVTPMIQPFCSTSGMHKRAPSVPRVCEGYGTVEAVSDDCFVSTTSTCLPLPFLWFLPFLCVAVVTGGIVVGSSTLSPALFRPMTNYATILARVDVCSARVSSAGRAISF